MVLAVHLLQSESLLFFDCFLTQECFDIEMFHPARSTLRQALEVDGQDGKSSSAGKKRAKKWEGDVEVRGKPWKGWTESSSGGMWRIIRTRDATW